MGSTHDSSTQRIKSLRCARDPLGNRRVQPSKYGSRATVGVVDAVRDDTADTPRDVHRSLAAGLAADGNRGHIRHLSLRRGANDRRWPCGNRLNQRARCSGLHPGTLQGHGTILGLDGASLASDPLCRFTHAGTGARNGWTRLARLVAGFNRSRYRRMVSDMGWGATHDHHKGSMQTGPTPRAAAIRSGTILGQCARDVA